MAGKLSAAGVEVVSEGSGPAVVMLHCLGVDHHVWDDAAAALGPDFKVMRYDFPGHGTTSVPSSAYDIEDLSAQLRELLQQQGVKRASVVGISLGGLVAQHFAATNPEMVDKVVLVDTTPRYTDASRAMWAERAATARGKGVAAMTEHLLTVWFTSDFVKGNPPAVRYVRERFAKVAGEGYALACETLARADLRELTPTIKAPTLVVCGTEDIPDFQEAARWMAKAIPNARLEWLSPARHASPLEQPEAFGKMLRSFLTE
jgi:3-oxoadipate enol-lactonase